MWLLAESGVELVVQAEQGRWLVAFPVFVVAPLW
jgi:hypothetical protein